MILYLQETYETSENKPLRELRKKLEYTFVLKTPRSRQGKHSCPALLVENFNTTSIVRSVDLKGNKNVGFIFHSNSVKHSRYI